MKVLRKYLKEVMPAAGEGGGVPDIGKTILVCLPAWQQLSKVLGRESSSDEWLFLAGIIYQEMQKVSDLIPGM